MLPGAAGNPRGFFDKLNEWARAEGAGGLGYIQFAADGAKATGDWTIITRDDGLKQWAYKGKPVYAFAKDTKAGDKTGDGFLNGAWHIAK